ncbi:MAG: hypothetical protein H7249_09345 [Chitinophagaceae bacterium]|nr:hypothetical protein [Oligoflexus sp.]
MVKSQALVFIGISLISARLFGQESTGHSAIFRSPFHTSASGFGLTTNALDQDSELSSVGPSELSKVGLDPRFIARQKSFQGLSLYTDTQIESASYGFDLDKIPICDLEVKIHRTMDGLVTVMGEIPKVSQKTFAAADWADLEQVRKMVAETLLMSSMGADFKPIDSKKCLWSQTAELTPAWQVSLTAADGLNYEIITDGKEVFKFDPKHFHEVGSANVYQTNKLDGAATPIALPDMDASGYLSNKFFEVCMPSITGSITCASSPSNPVQPFAIESNWQYNYDPSTGKNKFIQASLFAHTNVHLAWLQAHGFSKFGTNKIHILAHAVFSRNDINNALYQPADGSALPMILVGDGDDNILTNLGTDADVVAHELGHHVIFNSVTQISGESLVIHEAIADYFTFARTGNSCLGESICPDTPYGRQVCVKPTQCLRSADNALAFGDANLPTEAHQRGQFISGMLWDLHAKDGIALDDVTTLVLKGVDLLVYNSGYKHLVVAMMLVDHTNFQDKYCPTILARAKVRGLGSQLSDITCGSIGASSVGITKVTSAIPSEAETAVATPSAPKSSKKTCGVLGGDTADGAAGLALILSLPVVAWILRRRN